MDVDLMVLQERCRKDPASYREEFLMQRRHFTALLSAAKLQPSEESARLAEVASFMACVAPAYKEEGACIAPDIISLLVETGPAMHPHLRRALVRLLALMRARDAAEANTVLPLFFKLLSCNDKVLRRMLHGHIVSDLKRLHASGDKCRRELHAFLFKMIEDPSEVVVKRSLHVLVDLFRKRIWNDKRCANMIASACFHPSTTVAVIVARFLLDSSAKHDDNESDEDSDGDSDDEKGTAGKKSANGRKAADMWKAYGMTSKKTTKKRKRMERVIARATKQKTNQSRATAVTDQASSAAMALLNDPQHFAERLFSDLQTRRRKEKYETRLVFINLLTRLIGTNNLILFNVYPYLQRYLQPAQPEVTRVLAYLTQACHDLVPSDVLHPILRGIADTFVSEKSSPPSVAAGINTIRAICARVPLAIFDAENENKPEDEQEAPLLQDLVQYKTSKDKGVMMASRSLIALYRELHPKLLHKRDRGRAASEAVQKGKAAPAPAYSALLYATGVDGVEVLEEDDSEGTADGAAADDSEERNSPAAKRDAGNNDKDGKHLQQTPAGTSNRGSKENSGSAAADWSDSHNSEGKEADVAAPSPEGSQSQSGESDDDTGSEHDSEHEAEDEDTTAQPVSMAGSDVGVDGSAGSAKGRADAVRILTDEDFARIRARTAARAVEGAVSLRSRDSGNAVKPSDIQGVTKRERRTLEERLESVLAGREGREKYGSRRSQNKGGGSSNKKKLKTKANSMVLHKRRRGNKLSRRERQLARNKKRDYR